MGAELVGLVIAGYSDLPGTQYKALVKMAHAALDRPHGDQAARVYRAGWEPISMALGRKIEEDPERRKVLRHEVSKVCAQLVKAGAIERISKHPQPGTQQSYRLVLNASAAMLKPVDNSGGNG